MRQLLRKPLQIRNKFIGGKYPLLCTPLQEKETEKLLSTAQKIVKFSPDLIEWRIDSFTHLSETGRCLQTLGELRALLQEIPLLLTCRIPQQGGSKRMQLSPHKRQQLLLELIASKNIDLVDVELSNGSLFLQNISVAAKKYNVKTIFSHHDFATTPSEKNLVELAEEMQKNGADILKLVVMPCCHRDLLTLFSAVATIRAVFPDMPMIAIAMGELGKISRIAAGFFGSDITFTKVTDASAPGQLHIEEMRQMVQTLY